MEMVAEYRPESDDFVLTDNKDLFITVGIGEIDTLRETVILAMSDRFQHTGRII